jgi:hypothetical protein
MPVREAAEEAERLGLGGAFREAYLEGLLRGLPLAGVLGADLVHPWSGADPPPWVQNWRSRREYPNSWGIPSLVLALAGQGRVFLVQGAILDRYGKTGGRGGANGAAGYGAPLGNEFYYRGGRIQRFEGGHILIDREGTGLFLPLEAEAPAEVPAPVGWAPDLPAEVTAAFRSAWAALPAVEPPALSMPAPLPLEEPEPGAEPPAGVLEGLLPLVPDGDVSRVRLAANPPESPFLGAENLYFQSFNQGRALLLLSDSPVLPFRARLLAGPFLKALTGPPAGGSLLAGLGLYGLPLTDPQPLEAGDGFPLSPPAEAQRFSRGWFLIRN